MTGSFSPKATQTAGQDPPARRLFVYNGGFLTQRRVRRILELSGYDIRLGKPGPDDMVGVWGQSPTAPRGEAVAQRLEAPILRVEDALLRSVLPGRSGAAPLGLFLDRAGVHFDASTPSELEQMLADHPLDDTALLNRARTAIDRLKALHLSKYNAFDPQAPVPDPGYVLVIDQTEGDASVTASGGSRARLREMLAFAEIENPGARILIKTHPDTAMGHRPGYFRPEDTSDRTALYADAVSPWRLLEGAVAVYTWSSQLGFEAIMAGHKPRVFGQPFYAGWGLTQDENPPPRRTRTLTRAQLFAAAMILAPTWYDPYRDRLCTLEGVIDTLAAQARAWREDHAGWVASGMRLWKRPHLQRFFGQTTRLRFAGTAPEGVRQMVWASAADTDTDAVRVEDGFLRSRGLGAHLVPPLSLVCDDLGIYYDPSRESRLERMIASAASLRPDQQQRAERLIAALTAGGLTKYNQGGDTLPDLPAGRRILVPGQVEDDASIRLGCTGACTNLDLLTRCRAENPDAVLLFKPHPDVEAGLRPGAVDPETALTLADQVLSNAAPAPLLDAVDEVWTLTSLIGFEALLRGRAVTCLGAPFYAGWGLTRDLGDPPARRTARPGLTGLVHAALIDYPRYLDPVTGLPCPVEVALDRLGDDTLRSGPPALRILAKLQGLFASATPFWR